MEAEEEKYAYVYEQINKIRRLCDDIEEQLKNKEASFIMILGDVEMTIYTSQDKLEDTIANVKRAGFKVKE